MYQVKIDDMILTVDQETAEQLKDPEYAAIYIAAVKREILKDVPETAQTPIPHQDQSNLWKSPKNPTEEDHKASLALLALRRFYNNEFSDKKTHKNELWMKIAKKMNETGFFIGEGVQAREKVRQKFCNMQSSYIKYCDAQKRTGEGKLRLPKYFNELDEILGDKHKVNPILIIDSASPQMIPGNEEPNKHSATYCGSSSTSSDGGSARGLSTSGLTNSEGGRSSVNRFNSIRKTVRPKHEKVDTLKELVLIQKQNQDIRNKEFSSILQLLQEQNEQRNKQIMCLIDKLGEKKKEVIQ